VLTPYKLCGLSLNIAFHKKERSFYLLMHSPQLGANTMVIWKHALGALGVALALVGCGGGSGDAPVIVASAPAAEQPPAKPIFTNIVNFGDSLSDVGTYKVGAIAAVGGGQFTVNSPTAKNWTAVLADKFSLTAPCAAQTGLSSIIPTLPAVTVQNVVSCNNYAQGSARVTNIYGPNSVAIQQAVLASTGSTTLAISAAGIGLMAVPVATQMANHLTKVSGAYNGKELVTVMAGGNDVFLNFGGLQNASSGGPSAATAAFFAGWSPSIQSTVSGGGATATNTALQAAITGMSQAGSELATLVKTQVLAKGAKYVVVVNLPDVSKTPLGIAAGPGPQSILASLATAFNVALENGLSGQSGVVLVDAFTQSGLQASSPSQFSLTNVTTPACDRSATTTNILGGSSLTCTSSPASNTLASIDVSKFQYADDVHPTPYGYKLLADFVETKLVAAGWK
jgi:outer membrane lipase/esterase